MTTQYSKVWFISASALLVSLALAAFPAAARPADDPWRASISAKPRSTGRRQSAFLTTHKKASSASRATCSTTTPAATSLIFRISLDLAGKPDDCRQELVSPRRADPRRGPSSAYGPIEVAQEAFAVGTPDRRDVLLARFVNRGTAPASVQSTLAIFTASRSSTTRAAARSGLARKSS